MPRHLYFIQRDVIDAAVFSFFSRSRAVENRHDLLAQDEGENSENDQCDAGCYPHVERSHAADGGCHRRALIAAIFTAITLLAGIHNAIAAGGELAIIAASVRLGEGIACTVVTLLFAFTRAIAADGKLARVGTGIGVCLIAVIALFACFLHAIAAAGQSALVAAEVVADLVAVVALLAGLDNAIATRGLAAGVGTAVRIDVVRVITLLARLDDAVPATSAAAAVAAAVAIRSIAIVAFLTGLDDAVPARGGATSIRASVGVDLIPVIAGFADLHDTVAAARQLADCRAHVRAQKISVIALLARLLNAVAAARKLANVAAGIAVDRIAVIALLAAVHNAIAAVREQTRVRTGVCLHGISIITLLTEIDGAIAAERRSAGRSNEKNRCCGSRRIFRRSSFLHRLRRTLPFLDSLLLASAFAGSVSFALRRQTIKFLAAGERRVSFFHDQFPGFGILRVEFFNLRFALFANLRRKFFIAAEEQSARQRTLALAIESPHVAFLAGIHFVVAARCRNIRGRGSGRRRLQKRTARVPVGLAHAVHGGHAVCLHHKDQKEESHAGKEHGLTCAGFGVHFHLL